MVFLRFINFSHFLNLLHLGISGKFAFICKAVGPHDDDSDIRMEI